MEGDRLIDDDFRSLHPTKEHQKPTPLPWLQISILVLIQVCEPMTAESIYPYINQLVSELDITGGDKRKVGYYAGLLFSLFFVTEAMTVLYWNRISDRVGRKPILIFGLFGTALSMLCFGLSRTFWALVFSRCLCGLLNGNIGVMKSALGDLTDHTNRAQGYAFIPVAWSVGASIGPWIGGSLSKPHDNFPSTFQGAFWQEYPYFLPCLITSGFVLLVAIIFLKLFKETAPKLWTNPYHLLGDLTQTGNTVPLNSLLTRPVIISISNCMVHACIAMVHASILPLFFSMPIELGGLGFSPRIIGFIMGIYGLCSGLFQVLFVARIVQHLGERSVFLIGLLCYIPAFISLPIMNAYARQFRVTPVIWVLVTVTFILLTIADMAYAAIYMFITASAPNRSLLGTTNGLAQTAVSVVNAVSPVLSTSALSFSVEKNILGGYGAYILFLLLVCSAMLLALKLPYKMWEEHDDDILQY